VCTHVHVCVCVTAFKRCVPKYKVCARETDACIYMYVCVLQRVTEMYACQCVCEHAREKERNRKRSIKRCVCMCVCICEYLCMCERDV
jgi:hypothetical protein